MAIQKIFVDYDLNKNKILNARMHPVTTADRVAMTSSLTTSDEGLMVYDIDTHALFVWIGTLWLSVTSNIQDVVAGNAISSNNISGIITLDVNVDGSSIIILNDQLQIKDGGVTTDKLSTINNTPGQYGSSTAIPKLTVDSKGRVTDITTDPVFIPSGALKFIGEVTGNGNTGSDTSLTMVNAAVTGKVLTGLNLTPGGTILDTDSILAAFGKLQNQLSALLGGVSYQGVWDASTNTPTITSNTGVKGHYYIVSALGTININGISDWRIGDWIIFNGAAWDKVDNTDAVSSVNGFTGAVSLTTDNIPEALINQYFTNSRARQAISLTVNNTYGLATYDNITGVLNIPNYTTDLSGYIPYNGANQAVNLGNYNLTVKEIVIGTGAKNNTNIAIGRSVMSYSSSGSGNVAIGFDALFVNGSDGNVIIGYEAGYYMNNGGNVMIGYQAGKSNGPASNSIGIGYQALQYNSSGGNNIAIGYQAGSQLSGSNNTIIGGYVGETMSNHIVLADGIGNIRYRYDGTNNNFYQKVIFGSTLGNGTYTYALPSATGTLALTSDLSTYVPISRTLSINGTTYDLSTDRSWVVSGMMPAGGTAGQILAKIDGTNYNTEWIDNYSTQIKVPVKLGAALTKGTPVYTSSADGTNIIVSAASNVIEATSSKTMGLLETGGALNDQVKVVTYGLLAGLDTSAANAAGDPVWLGPDGTLIFGLINKPYAPAHLVYIGVVTRKQQNNGEIFITVQNGFEMDELHNVSARNPANNAILAYNTTTSLWEKNTITGVLGYTPSSGSGTTNYLSKWTSSSAIGNSSIYDNGTQVTVGATNGVRAFNIYSGTADNHLAIYGPAPSVSMSDSPVGTYQAKFGLATANGQYATGAVAGDFVVISQTGSTIWSNGSSSLMKVSQSGQLALGTMSPDASAKLQMESTTQGFLPPRMTSAQRTAISTPATGLVVYQTDGTEGLYIKTSTGWKSLVMA